MNYYHDFHGYFWLVTFQIHMIISVCYPLSNSTGFSPYEDPRIKNDQYRFNACIILNRMQAF